MGCTAGDWRRPCLRCRCPRDRAQRCLACTSCPWDTAHQWTGCFQAHTGPRPHTVRCMTRWSGPTQRHRTCVGSRATQCWQVTACWMALLQTHEGKSFLPHRVGTALSPCVVCRTQATAGGQGGGDEVQRPTPHGHPPSGAQVLPAVSGTVRAPAARLSVRPVAIVPRLCGEEAWSCSQGQA